MSVSALATDELYIVQKTLCLLVETFYRPLLPSVPEFAAVIQLLHEDILKLCQGLLFGQGDLASSVLILVRIDSQLDDKDIRRKCKQLEDFSTADFGLSEHLQLNSGVKQTFVNTGLDQIQEVEEEDANETVKMSMHVQSLTSSARSSTTLFFECEESKDGKEEFVIRNEKLAPVSPYTKSIKKIKETFKNKRLSPIEKLIQVKEVVSLLKSEIQEYWEWKSPCEEFQIELDRSDVLSILIYILVKAQIDDLRAQFEIIRSFTSNGVQDGFSRLSAAFSDFKNAVNFICYLDKTQITTSGSKYLKTVSMDKLKTMMYEYPDSSDTGSQLTSYDLYGVSMYQSRDNAPSFLSNRQLNRVSCRPTFDRL